MKNPTKTFVRTGVLTAAGGLAAVIGLAVTIFTMAPAAKAQPAYAQKTGLHCSNCHVNLAGGGKLTALGTRFLNNGLRLPAPSKSKTSK